MKLQPETARDLRLMQECVGDWQAVIAEAARTTNIKPKSAFKDGVRLANIQVDGHGKGWANIVGTFEREGSAHGYDLVVFCDSKGVKSVQRRDEPRIGQHSVTERRTK